MRSLIFVAVTLSSLIPVEAFSKCAGVSDTFYPTSGTEVPTNFQIVYETGSFEGANMNYYLESKTERIQIAYERFGSGYQKVQFILKPKKPLQPNTQYELKSGHEGNLAAKWKTTGSADTEIPKPMMNIVAQPGKRQEFGCGPGIQIPFLNVKTTEPGMVQIRVIYSKDERHFLISQGEPFTVGHGMCSGNFDFSTKLPGNKYHVAFATRDWAGNVGPYSDGSPLIEPKQ